MKMRNNYYFLLAAFVVAAALLKYGAPLLPVAVGVAAVGLWNWLKTRRAAPGKR